MRAHPYSPLESLSLRFVPIRFPRVLQPLLFFAAAASALAAQTAGKPQPPTLRTIALQSPALQPVVLQNDLSAAALPDDPSTSLSYADPTSAGQGSSSGRSSSSPAQAPAQNPPGVQPSPANPSPLDTSVTVHPSHYLTLSERFRLQSHTTFGPVAVVFPAAEAGVGMAHPPRHYPREWSDGGAAFARNYGSIVGGRTAGGLTHFVSAWVDHEDPRYFRDLDHHAAHRVSHALLFTFFDRANSGHRTLALSNFAAAAASGFICNLWQPDGFNDYAHGLQRSTRGFTALGSSNLVAEFSPELSKLMHKMHLPDSVAGSILPRSY